MYLSFCDIFITCCFRILRSYISVFFHASPSQQIGVSSRANVSNELKRRLVENASEMREGMRKVIPVFPAIHLVRTMTSSVSKTRDAS